MLQGLLDLHAVLDNPFGRHPAKVPLRACIAELLGTTAALLEEGDELPLADMDNPAGQSQP